MKDQFLLAHSVASRVFTLAGLRPVSIRDQMLRGEWLVERLCAEGMIGSQHQLLVIGAGAGGVTAALSACERGVLTTLVERSKIGAFGTQLESGRYIDPAMYDWPAPHWENGAWPLRGRKSPLSWKAGSASAVAGFWEASFEAKLEALGGNPGDRLHFAKGIEVKRGHLRESDSDVRFNWRDPERTDGEESYGAAIVCSGFPKEITSVPESYAGFEFWAPDPYGMENLGLERSTVVKALVSGAGDGALQDFLRLVMKPGTDARDVVNHIQWADAGLLSCEAILRAEDEASRARQWARPSCDTLAGWHVPYVNVASGIWKRSSENVRERLRALLWLGKGGKPRHDVVLAHSCSHFGECYPLNRLAVLIMAQAYAEAQGTNDTSAVLWDGYRLERVAPVDGHRCGEAMRVRDCNNAANALDCHGQKHSALLAPHTCRTKGKTFAPSTLGVRELERNVIIVRHGLEPFNAEFGAPRFPRQHLPYDIPGQ